jgi:hypothetical protein
MKQAAFDSPYSAQAVHHRRDMCSKTIHVKMMQFTVWETEICKSTLKYR